MNNTAMEKKYRIKTVKDYIPGLTDIAGCAFIVQVKAWWGAWVNVKVFFDLWDPDWAMQQAEELLEKLEE